MRHRHQHDRAYDSVVLHVVGEADCDVARTDGTAVPQLVLPCPAEVERRYGELRRAEVMPPCYAVLPSQPRLTVHSWLSALQAERLGRRRRPSACGWSGAGAIGRTRSSSPSRATSVSG